MIGIRIRSSKFWLQKITSTTSLEQFFPHFKLFTAMRSLALILIFLLSVAVGSTKNKPAHKAPEVRVIIHSMKDYTPYEAFAYATAAKLEKVLNSKEFLDKLMDARLTLDRGRSNREVYNHLMMAHEESGPGGEDGVVDLRLRIVTREADTQEWMDNCKFGSSTRTIGIDGSGTGINAVCPNWLQCWAEKGDTAALAGHFIHEYMHTLGYVHYHPWKYKSVPYQIGNIVEAILNKNKAKLECP